MRIAFVVSEFNFDVTMSMLEQAKRHAEFLGAEITHEVTVPGTFDMPIVIKKLCQRKDVDGIVCLGAVVEGETEHDDIVIGHASRKMADLAVEYGKPVGMGITGPGMSRLQAEARIDRAKAAVEAVVKLHDKVGEL
jgi:6,7-dimethyl-8-ribityllumazine synthase